MNQTMAVKNMLGSTSNLLLSENVRIKYDKSNSIKKPKKGKKLAFLGCALISFLYFMALFGDFFAPNDYKQISLSQSYMPPQLPHWNPDDGFYIHPVLKQTNSMTLESHYRVNKATKIKLRFLVPGEVYTMFNLFNADIHFFGILNKNIGYVSDYSNQTARFYLLGTDKLGRCILSRIIKGSQLSLSVGLLGVTLTLFLGVIMGCLSGYFGGVIDNLIQRCVEILDGIPKIPLWLALSAALPNHWSGIQVYLSITVILGLLSWTDLCRMIRGKVLSLREEKYCIASEAMGSSNFWVMRKHLLPGLSSPIIVILTINISQMILAETALSFLGIGLVAPTVSWGVLLQDSINLATLSNYPWIISPVFFVMISVIGFNLIGDALRDKTDSYTQ